LCAQRKAVVRIAAVTERAGQIVAGLILAAGAGTRFGDTPKQLAPLGGRPLLQWAVDAQCAVDPALLDPIVVVLGAAAAEIAPAIAWGRARTVVCDDWGDGQSASLRRGLRELADADRVLVTLGDAPLVSTEVIARLAREGMGALPVRATYGGRPGHPVVLGRAQLEALRDAHGDQGARGLLRDARTIEAGHLCSGRDVDTPDDLKEIAHAV
jgi:CTP:molybdopterin cytidylyltransferase MocA